MTKIRVASYSISLDGYGAGPNQTLEDPMGAGAEHLHDWFRETRTFRSMSGEDGGTDEMHLAISPVLLGSGKHLLAGIDLPALGYERTEHATTPNALHVVITKR